MSKSFIPPGAPGCRCRLGFGAADLSVPRPSAPGRRSSGRWKRKSAICCSTCWELIIRATDPAAMILRDRGFENFPVAAGEFREIARLRAAVFGFMSGFMSDKLFGPTLFGNQDQATDKTAEFEGRLKEFLGETRFASYQRAK